jgi:hypothetical protein
MCPLAWQDHYNLNEKGMMPLDMRMLLTLLEAIDRVCTREKGKQEEKAEKASFNGKKGKKGQVLILRPAFTRKYVSPKIATSARSMGAHTQPTVLVSIVSMRKTELRNLVSVPLRKVEREAIPLTRTLRS